MSVCVSVFLIPRGFAACSKNTCTHSRTCTHRLWAAQKKWPCLYLEIIRLCIERMTPGGSQKVTPLQLGRQFCERFTYSFCCIGSKKPCVPSLYHIPGYYTKHLIKKPPYLSSIFTRISVAAAFSDCKHPPSFLHTAGISSLPSFLPLQIQADSLRLLCLLLSHATPPPHPPFQLVSSYW